MLAIAAPERVAPLPDVPTFKELGKDFTYSVWLGLLARKETPQEAVDRLSEALEFALNELGPQFRESGSDPTFQTLRNSPASSPTNTRTWARSPRS